MHPDYEIILGRGIGGILLGMPKRELAELLGAADEIEHPDDPGRENWETWSYNSINCSFSFDPGHEDRLSEISVENGYFHIGKKIRVGLKKDELLVLGAEFKFGHCIIEDKKDDEFPTREQVSYHQAGLNLWLDDGIISAILVSPLRTEENVLIWPEYQLPARP